MKHKAPCLSRGYNGLRESGPLDIKETVKGKDLRTQKQRDRSNLGGDLAPPKPWEPRTRGETLLPSREEVKEEAEEGGSLPLASGGAGTLPGAIIITAIYTNTSAIFTNISITFPLLYPVVHSPATCCTLYLNMVLYASYYFPMMCCHPMMSE